MNTQDLLSIIAIVLSALSILISIWMFFESKRQNKETSVINTEIKKEIQKLEKSTQVFNTLYMKHTEDLTNILKIHTEEDKNIIMKFLNGKKS
jgi:hypothetical protein